LSDRFNLAQLENRIVLIGTSDPSFNDHRWRTSCSDREAGVEVQAQMVSQILSTTLDNRPLLWSPSQFWETIWLLGWSLAVGATVYYSQTIRQSILYISFGVMAICFICQLTLIASGGWLPIYSSVLVLIITGSILVVYRYITSEQD